MPRYVVHIGPSKTGSTYLQRRLFQAREALLADGINYPDNWWTKPTQIEHNALSDLLRANRFAEVEATFREIAAQNHKMVVISSEDMENLTPAQFEKLRDAMGNNPVDIVYYCRRWCERIPSSWKQAIKNGLYPTLPEFYLATVRHALFNASANYSLIWDTICGVFGRKSLKLVSYSNLRDGRVDIFRHFAENFLDWNGETEVREGEVLENASLNAVDTEILRTLNWIDYPTKGRHSLYMHVKFSEMRLEFDTRMLEELMVNDIGGFEVSDAAEDFRLSWRDMKPFVDCLVPRTSPRKPIFEFRTVSVPYVQTNYLLNKGAAKELQRLYRQLRDAASDGM
jgi:hypothetical protein